MPRRVAVLELPTTLEHVWELLADPAQLAGWWPGINDVEAPDRGLVPGTRWHLLGSNRPQLFRSPEPSGELLVVRVERPRLVAWQLLRDRIDIELRLTELDSGGTEAVLTVEGPPLIGLRRSLPGRALTRLRALCQAGFDP
ncbi:MAG: SRPBCC family protein [Actinomycetota bacterium]|nr:SRPBCC family protein [Actinomycetota bacterium]MDQ2983487.1 SRPBCC family protein [Actinomycetota bacterium]